MVLVFSLRSPPGAGKANDAALVVGAVRVRSAPDGSKVPPWRRLAQPDHGGGVARVMALETSWMRSCAQRRPGRRDPVVLGAFATSFRSPPAHFQRA